VADITLRSVKGAPLTNAEVDANFVSLNANKAELASPSFTGTISTDYATVKNSLLLHDSYQHLLYSDAANSLNVRIGSAGAAKTYFKFVSPVDGQLTLDNASGGALNFAIGGNNRATLAANGDFNVSNGTNHVMVAGNEGAIELCRTASGGAYIDFKDSAGEDNDLRIQRNSGTMLSIGSSAGAFSALLYVGGAVQGQTNGSTGALIAADAGTNGANIALWGNGETTPNKVIRAAYGVFEVINHAYAASILKIADDGTASLGINAANNNASLLVAPAASSVNYVGITGAAAGGQPVVAVNGSDATIPLGLAAKDREINFYTNAALTARQFVIQHAASAVNYLQVAGGATTARVELTAQGETNVGVNVRSAGTGGLYFWTGGGTQFAVSHTASAVNYLQVSGGAAGGWPTLSAQGADSNPGLLFIAKGTGGHHFSTGGTFSNYQLQVSHVASAVNYVEAYGGTAGNGVNLRANGGDTSVSLNLRTKGSGVINFYTSDSATQLRVKHTASAVNYLTVAGSTGSSSVTLAAEGTAGTLGIDYRVKNLGFHTFYNDTSISAVIGGANNAQNYLWIKPGTTGGGPTLEAAGETNVSLRLAAAGTGIVNVLSQTQFNQRAYTNPVDVAFSATPTFDASASNVFWFGTLTANVTSCTINNPVSGQTIQIRVVQDGTGGRTFTVPAGAKIDSAPTTGANRVSWLTMTYVGTVNGVAVNRWEGAWGDVPA
jgi:hypothetical protein